jgi:hypothetical protein
MRSRYVNIHRSDGWAGLIRAARIADVSADDECVLDLLLEMIHNGLEPVLSI